jgi:predicted MFS family arabinose efflux permease
MSNTLERRYLILAGLFMSKTIPAVFFMMSLPVILRLEGYSLEVIALLQLAALPYLLKFLWAPLIDRNGAKANHYKKWILWTGLVFGGLLILLGFQDLHHHFTRIVALVMIISVVAATQDIAISALYIKLLSFEERGLGSSSKVMAINLASIMGSGLFLLVYNHLEWQASVSGMGVIVLAVLMPLPLLREEQNASRCTEMFRWTAMFSFIKGRGMPRWFLLILFNSVSASAVYFMLKPLLVDKGVATDTIALLMGFYGMGVAARTSVAPGNKRFQQYLLHRRRAYIDSVILSAVAVTAFIPISLSAESRIALYLAVALINVAVTVASVVSATLIMDFSRAGLESNDYSLQITGIHLGAMLMSAVSGTIVAAIGYTVFFTWQAVFGVAMIVVTATLFKGDWIPKVSLAHQRLEGTPSLCKDGTRETAISPPPAMGHKNRGSIRVRS